jgi:DNA-binding MarR family transcriptional regulator
MICSVAPTGPAQDDPRRARALPDTGAAVPETSAAAAAERYRSLGFTISTTGFAISHRFSELLAPLELEPRDFSLLRAVGLAAGLSQQTLAERLQIPAPRLVAFIDSLEQRGLIERRQNPADRRVRALHLTAAGQVLLERAFELASEHERNICSGLDEQQRLQLLDLLDRVGAQLGLDAGLHTAHSALTST